MLEPGQGCIKPNVDVEKASELIQKLYGLTPQCGVSGIKEFVSYDDRNFYFKPDISCKIKEDEDVYHENGYILKITNTLEDPEVLKAQNQLMLHLHGKQIIQGVPKPIKNKLGTYLSMEEISSQREEKLSSPTSEKDYDIRDESQDKKKHAVRMITFIPGQTLYAIRPWTTKHFYQCGKLLAQLMAALKDFKNTVLSSRKFIWQLSSVPNLRDFLDAIKDDLNRQMCLEVIDAFDTDVVPIAHSLEKGIIHGDFNEQNILVRMRQDGIREVAEGNKKTGEDYDVFGVIDFGDSHENPYVFDLATTIMYMMTQCEVIDPNLAGGHVLAGYKTVRQVTSLEMDVLKVCIAARYTQSLVLGAYTHQQDPSNDYVLITAKTGWKNLRRFWEVPKDVLYKQWNELHYLRAVTSTE